jgi:hypothetical protein
MPKGIYQHKSQQGFQKGHHSYLTEESKKKIGEASKGNKRALGCKHSEEQNKAKSKRQKGMNTWMKGKHHSEETRIKCSEVNKGKRHWNWKGGLAPLNHRIRNGIEIRLWREAVFARDNFICQKYGIIGGKLHAHHINNFADFPELRFAIDNGITFSDKAHKEFHKKYGVKNNTREQINEFLK